jgi:lipopolysaccharide export LptBFGC system permease protein LptF
MRLWKLADPESRAELARRVSLPLLAASLLLMGIGLGYGHPRFQGGSGLIGALGVMVVYYVLYRSLENRLIAGNELMFYLILLLPLCLAAAAWFTLTTRMKPHRSWSLPFRLDPGRLRKAMSRLEAPERLSAIESPGDPTRRGILGSWSRRLWLKAWGGVLATLLLLHLLIEYSSVAGDFSANHRPLWEFFVYWFWRLPAFLTIALPISFMLGTVFALSTATLSNEWVALRTGGVSLGQWIWRARGAWLSVLGLTLLVQHFAIPAGEARVRAIQQRLFHRPGRSSDASTWQYLGSTGVLWYMEAGVRWGFPLKSPGEAPALLIWRPGNAHSQGLPWDGFGLRQGPETGQLFPDASLMGTPVVEENSTMALMQWQKWAYEPSRATHLWARFLSWLAGPCLVLAVLPRAFPNPRAGRGSALAFSLIGGLLFLGLQLLFNGAAQAGEIPAVWGVLGPLLLAVAAGATQLRHLRT